MFSRYDNHFSIESFTYGLESISKILAFVEKENLSLESESLLLSGYIHRNRRGLPDSVLSCEDNKTSFISRAIEWVKTMLAKLVNWVKSIGSNNKSAEDKIASNLTKAKDHLESLKSKLSTEAAEGISWTGTVPERAISGDSKTTSSKVESVCGEWIDDILKGTKSWADEIKVVFTAKTHESHFDKPEALLKDLEKVVVKLPAKSAKYESESTAVFGMLSNLIKRSNDACSTLRKQTDDVSHQLDDVMKELSTLSTKLNSMKAEEFEVKVIEGIVKTAGKACEHVRHGAHVLNNAGVLVSGVTLPLLGHQSA